MSTTIRLGISTCPNDTFAFHGLLNGLVSTGELDFDIELLDIQQLNEGLFAERFDVAKASFHAALLLADRMSVLPSGSALGFGVGPLLLASRADTSPTKPGQTTLCPGRLTTASLLFQLFYPATTQIEHVVFSDIMPKLQQQQADFGVCIHEGRFTWQTEGLSLVEDLGVRWEKETGCPLPLGGILASNKLSPSLTQKVQNILYDSVQLALADPAATLPTMRKYAQEFHDDVLMQHVDLYVNDWTVELGQVGRNALQELSKRSVQAGITSAQHAELRVLGAEPNA